MVFRKHGQKQVICEKSYINQELLSELINMTNKCIKNSITESLL